MGRQFLLIDICTLCIHEYVIDEIVRRKLKKIFQCQFSEKKQLQSVLLRVDRKKWEGGSRGFEGCACLVGWWYVLYACYALNISICFLRDLMFLLNNGPK